MKSLSVTIEMKDIELYVPVDKLLKCDHSKES